MNVACVVLNCSARGKHAGQSASSASGTLHQKQHNLSAGFCDAVQVGRPFHSVSLSTLQLTPDTVPL